jgi:succinyl-CoA synthetase beta subunit
MQLVTPQTSAEGKKVRKVLIAEDVYYPGESETSEFYVSVLLNRAGRNMIVFYRVEWIYRNEHTPELILLRR